MPTKTKEVLRASVSKQRQKEISEVCERLGDLGRRRRRVIKRENLIRQPAESNIVSMLCEFPENAEFIATKSGIKTLYVRARLIREITFKILKKSKEFESAMEKIQNARGNANRTQSLLDFKTLLSVQFAVDQNGSNQLSDNEKWTAIEFGPDTIADLSSSKIFDAERKTIEESMEQIVSQLHIFKWWIAIQGLSNLSLANVISETGDLFNYDGFAKVWKRMGLSVYEGKASSTWRRKGGLSSEEWSKLGYCPRRRSVAYASISQPIIFQNKGAYKKLYETEKAAIKIKHPDWKPGHADFHGRRMVEKKILRQLWRRWWATTEI